MGLVVKRPGVCTTVQDMGRFGYQGSGFSPSGVMDRRAAALANILVENPPDTSVLEFALIGPTIRFTTSTIIAITGGDFRPLLGGKPVAMNQAFIVHRGSLLSFGKPVAGTYGYISFTGGGLDVPEVMGSRSTNMKCRIGGVQGRALIVGDYVPFTTKTMDYMANLRSHVFDSGVLNAYYEFDKPEVTVRVVLGPQDDRFTEEGLATFLSEPFVLTSSYDRMGYRFDGPKIETIGGSDIISDGIPFGAVQVPSHGHPIIMMADRQTTGGYAKIATIASVDIPKMVQCSPGTKVRFSAITVQEAQHLIRLERRLFRTLTHKVRRPSVGGISPRRAARRLSPILERQAEHAQTEILWIQQ